MKFGSGFWPSLWFVQAFVEVALTPKSSIAWIFLAVASAYWMLKIHPKTPGGIRPVMWVLTGLLWVVSSLSFI